MIGAGELENCDYTRLTCMLVRRSVLDIRHLDAVGALLPSLWKLIHLACRIFGFAYCYKYFAAQHGISQDICQMVSTCLLGHPALAAASA